MEFISVYSAHGDGGERGAGPVLGYFSTEALAALKAENAGWYGGNGATIRWDAVLIDGEVYILKQRDPIDLDLKQSGRDDALKEETIQSLSDDQLRVLGLTRQL